MQEEFREEYRKANDSVHVPEELMERSVKAVRAEERRQKTTYFWKYAAMAACVCIVCFGGWKLTMGDRIRVQDVTFSSGEMQIGLTLGNQEAKPDGEEKKEQLTVETYQMEEKGNVPEELWAVEPSRINGEEVFLGQTEDGRLHAAYETGGQIYYIIEESGDRDFLIEYLKNNL